MSHSTGPRNSIRLPSPGTWILRRAGKVFAISAILGGGVESSSADGPVVESIVGRDGGPVPGRLVGDPKGGFRFEPAAGGPGIPLAEAGEVTFDATPGGVNTGSPPFRVEVGHDQRVSGRMGRADDRSITLEGGPGGSKVELSRHGALTLAQRGGEVLVFREGWENLDEDRWTIVGEPIVVDEPTLVGGRSLRLGADGSAVTHHLADPVSAGRLEVAFHDPGGMMPGHQWFVDLLFRGGEGQESIRVLLDAGDEGLGVRSTGGPALAVQRLARKPGWHRLTIRFGGDAEIIVDGNELAHGRGVRGALAEVRLAHQAGRNAVAEPEAPLAFGFDDLRVVRKSREIGDPEVAPGLDDVRLVEGDQIFGRFDSADPDGVRLEVEGRSIPLSWAEVSSVRFRRKGPIGPSRPVEGWLVRAEWMADPGVDPRDLDAIEGALIDMGGGSITISTPYAGDLSIPRDRMKALKVLGRGTRVVVDPTAHHLGNEVTSKDPRLDPPEPEGGTLERSVTLDPGLFDPQPRSAHLALDVVQVVGEGNGLDFADQVKKGELRTLVQVNGKQVDYINRFILGRNESPERVRVAIPPGVLKPGANLIRLEQLGRAGDPGELDDLGILSIAVEFDPPPP